MRTNNFCFYLKNRLIQTSQTGGQRYSDTYSFSIPWTSALAHYESYDHKKSCNIGPRSVSPTTDFYKGCQSIHRHDVNRLQSKKVLRYWIRAINFILKRDKIEREEN